MSENQSHVDRIFTNWSLDSGGPLTRSIADISTSGLIEMDATHWAIEPFIPITVDSLLDYLCWRSSESDQHSAVADQSSADSGQSSARIQHQTRAFADQLEKFLHDRTLANHHEFSKRYAAMDPDSDCRIPADLVREPLVPPETQPSVESIKESADTLAHTNPKEDADALMRLGDDVLIRAGYRHLTQDEIEKCVGVASQWGVPLKVNFDLFRHLAIYARGDIVGKRFRRRLRNLYRPELVDVPIYQRVVVLFQVDEDLESGEQLNSTELHLRMFKNIPKLDVDMLLPGTKVRLSKIDQAKIIVPSVGGWLLSLQKIGRFVLMFVALTMYTTAFVFALAIAAVGYLVKSVFSYFQTRNRYLLDLTRNLYFQKLDTNAGAAYRIIQQAHRQSMTEGILAYYAIASENDAISTRKLRRKCERMVREAVDIEIDFRVESAIETLQEMKVIERVDERRWRVADMQPAEN